jgi:predicted GIY-YIG superfamily endonuclease
MVYLLHFSKPFKHARHYMGSAEDPNERLETHSKGQGARLTQVAAAAGITFEIVRTWQGSRK